MYKLPSNLIAQESVKPRDSSRLMVVSDKIEYRHFFDMVDYLSKGDVLVLNETKVFCSRFKGAKLSGSPVEITVVSNFGRKCKCYIKGKPRVGNIIKVGKYKGEIVSVEFDLFSMEFNVNVSKIMKEVGEMPVPPYIKKKLEKQSSYQTVYSRKKGSVAAPTAGLHFTKRLLKQLEKKGVKIVKVLLHVGMGTYLPLRDLKAHKMHKEYFEVSSLAAKQINGRKGKLVAVGTTSLRALESSSKNGKVFASKGETGIFIKPGYKFQSGVDNLITNFHLPNTSLLLLVQAFAGKSLIKKVYSLAVKMKYRFYSLGDAMLLTKK